MLQIKLIQSNFNRSVFPFSILLLFISFCSLNTCFSQQLNAGINFQAIARDLASNPVNNRPIHVKVTILDKAVNGTPLFIESHQVNTDKSGVFNISIGNSL